MSLFGKKPVKYWKLPEMNSAGAVETDDMLPFSLVQNCQTLWEAVLPAVIGRYISPNDAAVLDIAGAPHILVAGSTGSGKTSCLHAIINGLLVSRSPASVRFLMVDCKRIELGIYNTLPHMMRPVAYSPDGAISILQYAIREMEARYVLMERSGVRSIEETKLPRWVIFIDELADLMLQSKKTFEPLLVRLAQLGRQAGMHLVMATQLPKASVVTGLLRVNIPVKLCFAVPSYTDSRVVLGYKGAEVLNQRGRCLLSSSATFGRLVEVKGAYITREEIHRNVNHWSNPNECQTTH